MLHVSGRASAQGHGSAAGLLRRQSKAARYVLLWLMVCIGVASAADMAGDQPAIARPELGIASWYGYPYHGHQAANGEIYDMEELTAAHRTLPFGTLVHVRNLQNEKAVDVRINDRGPFIDGRIIDLSKAAARAIGLIMPGITPVLVEVIGTVPAAEAVGVAAATANVFGVQAGAFRVRENADRFALRMKSLYGAAQIIKRDGNPTLWRVVVGREDTQGMASTLAGRVRQKTGEAVFVVRLDE
jgi:rare lipoprotein A